MGTTPALVDPALLEPYAAFIAHSELAELLGPPWAAPMAEDAQAGDAIPAAAVTTWRRTIRQLARRDPS